MRILVVGSQRVNVKPLGYFLCEGNYIDRFRNLRYCTFKVKSLIINNNNEHLQKNPCYVFELQQQNTLLHRI